jgi:RHS repeat-associated protein
MSKNYPATNLYPGTSVGFTYNARGQVSTRTLARGVKTIYNYFDTQGSQTGELKQVTYKNSDGSVDSTTPETDYTYTRWGAPATVTDGSGSRTFNYGADLKPTSEALDASFYNSGSSVTTNYDASVPGRPNGYSFNGNGTAGLTIAYDPASGQPSSVAGNQGGIFSLTYAQGTDWVKEVKNGSYDRLLPLASTCDVISSATTTCNSLQSGSFTATYTDPRGWRSGQTVASGPYATSLKMNGGNQNTFSFDDYGQLLGSTGTAGSRSFSWTYDLAGNRVKDTSNGVDTNYAAGTINQYTSITGNLWEGSPSYDADGNMTQDGTWTYAYDGENRLISMTTLAGHNPSQSLSFKYDYLGRRVRKTVTGTNASDTKFVWYGWQLVAELNAAANNAVTRSYVWGPDFSDAHGSAGGAGSLLAQISGGVVTYAMPDAMGNIVGYINSDGSLASAVEYTAFGRAITFAGSYSNFPIGFSGQYTDWETNLVYYGYRYYNPRHGRFINRDPSEEAGGLNLYAFCGNRAGNAFDTLGLDPITTTGQSSDYWEAYNEQMKAYNQALQSQYDGSGGSGSWGRTGYTGFLYNAIPGSDDPTFYNVDTGNPANEWVHEQYAYYNPPTITIVNKTTGKRLTIKMPGANQDQIDAAIGAVSQTINKHNYGPNSLSGTGTGKGSSLFFPYSQESNGTCWAASFRNYLFANGVNAYRIPSESELVNDVLASTMPSPLWGTPTWNDAAQILTDSGISPSQAENGLVPLANSLGVDSQFVVVGTTATFTSLSVQETRFDRLLDRGGAMMVNIPAPGSLLSASQGLAHVIEMQQTGPGSIMYIDPSGGGIQSGSTADAWHQYVQWSGYGGGYVIVPRRH